MKNAPASNEKEYAREKKQKHENINSKKKRTLRRLFFIFSSLEFFLLSVGVSSHYFLVFTFFLLFYFQLYSVICVIFYFVRARRNETSLCSAFFISFTEYYEMSTAFGKKKARSFVAASGIYCFIKNENIKRAFEFTP